MRKLYIVKNEREFDNIIKNGKCIKNKSFIIYFIDNDKPYNRYGVSVGKKLGNAVYRNKYKRKIRAIIDNSQKNYVNPKDYIIILRGHTQNSSYEELAKDFDLLMNNFRKDMKNE